MNIGIFIAFFISFVVYLFCVYSLSRDDFVFIRKNITTEDMFNVAFLLMPCMALFSRIFYVIFHYNPIFLNPLVFAAAMYHPGLSVLGAVIGGVVSTVGICIARKITVISRVVDIISLSIFASFVIGTRPYVTILSFSHKGTFFIELTLTCVFTFIFVLLLRLFLKEKFKDGSVSLLFLLSYAFLSIFLESIKNFKHIASFFWGEGSIFLIVLLVSSILFMRREKVQFKFKFFKKR